VVLCVANRVWDELTTFSVFWGRAAGLLSRTGFLYKTQAIQKDITVITVAATLRSNQPLAPPPPFQAAQLPQLCAQERTTTSSKLAENESLIDHQILSHIDQQSTFTGPWFMHTHVFHCRLADEIPREPWAAN
jgi:hypothetical protein